MKFLRNALLGALVLFGIAVLLFGASNVIGYLNSGRRLVTEHARNNVPFEIEIARLEDMVRKLDDAVLGNEKRLIEQEVNLEYLQREIGQRKEEMSTHAQILKDTQGLLSTQKATYDFRGHQVSWDELNRDALLRLDAYRAQKEYVQVRESTLATLQDAVDISRRQIEEARARRDQYTDMVGQLRAQNVKLQAKKELAATIQRIKLEDTGNRFAAAGDLYERLSKRLEVENKYLDRQIGLARVVTTTPTGSFELPRDAAAEIAAMLTPAAPASTVPAVEPAPGGDADQLATTRSSAGAAHTAAAGR